MLGCGSRAVERRLVPVVELAPDFQIADRLVERREHGVRLVLRIKDVLAPVGVLPIGGRYRGLRTLREEADGFAEDLAEGDVRGIRLERAVEEIPERVRHFYPVFEGNRFAEQGIDLVLDVVGFLL